MADLAGKSLGVRESLTLLVDGIENKSNFSRSCSIVSERVGFKLGAFDKREAEPVLRRTKNKVIFDRNVSCIGVDIGITYNDTSSKFRTFR